MTVLGVKLRQLWQHQGCRVATINTDGGGEECTRRTETPGRVEVVNGSDALAVSA